MTPTDEDRASVAARAVAEALIKERESDDDLLSAFVAADPDAVPRALVRLVAPIIATALAGSREASATELADEDLAAMMERCERATAELDRWEPRLREPGYAFPSLERQNGVFSAADANFIWQAREDLPRVISSLVATRARLIEKTAEASTCAGCLESAEADCGRFEAEIARLKEAQTTQRNAAWQAIESAPKTGKRIILGNTSDVSQGYWDCEVESEGGQCWRLDDPDMQRFEIVFDADPTHWQSLPPPVGRPEAD